jgi:hypothetical protein
MTGHRIGRQLSLATRRELIQAFAGRYHSAVRSEKKTILDEFTKVTGFHRKHRMALSAFALRTPGLMTDSALQQRSAQQLGSGKVSGQLVTSPHDVLMPVDMCVNTRNVEKSSASLLIERPRP